MRSKFVFPMLIFTLLALSFSMYQSVYVPYKAVQDMCEDVPVGYKQTTAYAKNRCLVAGYARLKNGSVK